MAHDGRIDLPPAERARYRAHIKDWRGKVVIHVRPWKAKRSSKANARYWALLTVAARELGEDSVEDLHESVSMHLLRLPDDERTGLPKRRRTPTLNTAEFADYTDACERFFRLELRLDLSDWEREIERMEAA